MDDQESNYLKYRGKCHEMCLAENCGEEVAEKDFHMAGNYPCCSEACCFRLVGL